ncbi:MAG: carboxylesterase/lipase family protein [Gammaproteobacteria bacterium]|nr:carboxylesterase/lipase family protein [Gammaproteobacteria bacterium]
MSELAESTCFLETQLGSLRGLLHDDVLHFRGIRYAQPPTGPRRFLPPLPTTSWSGVLDATEFPNRCSQPPMAYLGETVGSPSEDCLFLNIVTPAVNGIGRPVLFWIHGGAFINGSANDYDGSVLAAQGDVVVVTINYRLGLLGFLDLSSLSSEFTGSGSNGILDQILALKWVRDNIADFGGDPENITIFGESAGGHSVMSLLASHEADGLFHKAIAHSPGTTDRPPPDLIPSLVAYLGVNRDQLVSKLRTTTTDELLAIQNAVPSVSVGVDGEVVTRSTNEAIIDKGKKGVPLIAGTNKDEGKFFTALYAVADPDFLPPQEPIARIVTGGADPASYMAELKALHPTASAAEIFERIWDGLFRRAAIGGVVSSTSAGVGGWLYQFDLQATEKFLGHDVGAGHAVEIPFTFNRFNSDDPGLAIFYKSSDPDVRNLSQQWSDTIIQFAKTGEPNGAGLPHWPRYDEETRATMVLDRESRVENDLNKIERLLWDKS